MALAELVQKLRSKRQATERTSFQAYLATVKALASGTEVDSDEVAAILDAAGRSEADLERDVGIQQQRLSWHAQRVQNQQAVSDRQQAERDLQAAQRALQEAYDRLQPTIESAQHRMKVAEQTSMYCHQAEDRLTALVLDAELLEREKTVNGALRDVQNELRPLLQDREHKRHSLENAEFNLSRLRSRDEKTFMGELQNWLNTPLNVRTLKDRVADLQNQIQQLDRAIQPRLQEQNRLQAELDSIHQEKLKP